MAKDTTNQGGPTFKPKDAPKPDPDKHRKAQSHDELTERTHRPGTSRRNGSDKAPRG
jgi:hypothetical protein